MAENLKVFDFTLTEEEMQRIAALKRPDGRIANPVVPVCLRPGKHAS
jgi:2,5-diketo-D-gluconate reductase B